MEAHFACAACGKKFRWKAELAGKAGRCPCGARLVAPHAPEQAEAQVRVKVQGEAVAPIAAIPVAQAPGLGRMDEPRIASLTHRIEEDEGLYDVADDGPPAHPAPPRMSIAPANAPGLDEATRRSMSAMAFPAKPAFKPVLEEESTPAVPNLLWETLLCVILIGVGVALTLMVVMRYGKEPVPLNPAIGVAAIQIVVNLGLMVAAIFVAAYTIEDAFLDPWWKIILKTCAIGLCPGPIGQIAGAQIGDINGDIARVFITLGLYIGLFLLLFRLNILHALACVLVIWVIRTTVDYSLYKLEGLRKDSWL